MDDSAVAAAVAAAIAETGAASVKDMGKVMGVLKAKYAGQMDFQKASAAVKGCSAKRAARRIDDFKSGQAVESVHAPVREALEVRGT